MLGIRTRGHRMVGTDETTEQLIVQDQLLLVLTQRQGG